MDYPVVIVYPSAIYYYSGVPYHTWNLCSHVPPFPCFSLRLDFFVATHFEISRLFTGSSLGTDFKIWLELKLESFGFEFMTTTFLNEQDTSFLFEFSVGPENLKSPGKKKNSWNQIVSHFFFFVKLHFWQFSQFKN